MAKTSTISLEVRVVGDGVHLDYVPFNTPIINPASPAGGPNPVALVMGDTTLVVPTGTTSVLIVPPSTSTTAKVLKGAVMDVGIKLSMTAPTLLSIDPTQVTLVLNAAAAETVTIEWL